MIDEQMAKDIQEMIDLAFTAIIETSVELDDDQLDALDNLSCYCVKSALQNPEVIKKPLKAVYKANENLKEALVAICLSYALINPRRKMVEDKEYFQRNISIAQEPGNIKFIDFGDIAPQNVQAAIHWDIIEDWKLYYDKECGGIKALVDEKTHLTGLDNYTRGGDKMYEFARFHRKFTEKENKEKDEDLRLSENAYRNAVVQSVASEVAKQQLLEGKNPMEIINSLLSFSPKQQQQQKQPPKRIENQFSRTRQQQIEFREQQRQYDEDDNNED